MFKKLLPLIIGALLITLFNSASVKSQDLEAKVNELVQPLLDSKKNLGIAIGVFDIEGQYPRMFFFGKTTKEGTTKPDEYTVFEIGGVTSTFTTTMLVMLEREGKLRVTDPAQNYMPQGVSIHLFSSQTPIKLMHLATHTSGLPRLPSNLEASSNSKGTLNDPYKNYGNDELNTFINNYVPDFEPGTHYQFSSIGMGLLGTLTARASGITYENMLHKYILDSLGMTQTGITLTPEMSKNLAKGYDEKGEPTGLWNMGVMEGADGIRSNIKDMVSYLAFQMGKTDKMDFKDGLTLMQKRRFENSADNMYVGLGWFISESANGKEIIWQSGSTGGYRSFIGFMPELQTGVVVLTNQANSVDGIGVDILKYFNR